MPRGAAKTNSLGKIKVWAEVGSTGHLRAWGRQGAQGWSPVATSNLCVAPQRATQGDRTGNKHYGSHETSDPCCPSELQWKWPMRSSPAGLLLQQLSAHPSDTESNGLQQLTCHERHVQPQRKQSEKRGREAARFNGRCCGNGTFRRTSNSGREAFCQRRRHQRCRSIPTSGRCPGGGMATHSSILAWRIPGTEELGGLQSIGSQRVGHDWAT